MTIQETKTFFEGSEFSPNTKAKIFELLKDKDTLDPYTTLEIKMAMQAELAEDLASIDISKSSKAAEIEKAYSDEIEKIESDMKSDMELVDSELQQLEKIRTEALRISDSAKAAKIRETL